MGINDLKCCLNTLNIFEGNTLFFTKFQFCRNTSFFKVEDLNIIPKYIMNDGESNHDSKESSINEQRRV